MWYLSLRAPRPRRVTRALWWGWGGGGSLRWSRPAVRAPKSAVWIIWPSVADWSLCSGITATFLCLLKNHWKFSQVFRWVQRASSPGAEPGGLATEWKRPQVWLNSRGSLQRELPWNRTWCDKQNLALRRATTWPLKLLHSGVQEPFAVGPKRPNHRTILLHQGVFFFFLWSGNWYQLYVWISACKCF